MAGIRLPALGIANVGLSSLITTHNYQQATHLEAIRAIHSSIGRDVTEIVCNHAGFRHGNWWVKTSHLLRL